MQILRFQLDQIRVLWQNCHENEDGVYLVYFCSGPCFFSISFTLNYLCYLKLNQSFFGRNIDIIKELKKKIEKENMNIKGKYIPDSIRLIQTKAKQSDR